MKPIILYDPAGIETRLRVWDKIAGMGQDCGYGTRLRVWDKIAGMGQGDGVDDDGDGGT